MSFATEQRCAYRQRLYSTFRQCTYEKQSSSQGSLSIQINADINDETDNPSNSSSSGHMALTVPDEDSLMDLDSVEHPQEGEHLLSDSSTALVQPSITASSNILASRRMSWNQQLAELSKRLGPWLIPFLLNAQEGQIEPIIDLFPLLPEPNIFQADENQQQIQHTNPTQTPLLHLFFPNLVFQSSSVGRHDAQIAEESRLVRSTHIYIRGTV